MLVKKDFQIREIVFHLAIEVSKCRALIISSFMMASPGRSPSTSLSQESQPLSYRQWPPLSPAERCKAEFIGASEFLTRRSEC